MKYVEPYSVWINITDVCNNRCKWCYQKSMERTGRFMSFDIARGIINGSKRNGATDCIFIGGEPTFHPELPAMIKEAKKNDMFVIVISNGRFLPIPGYLDQLISAGVDAINISLHGWSKKSYQELTGSQEGFCEMEKAISLLKKMKVRAGNSFVLSNQTIPHLEVAIKSFSEIGVDFIEFNIASPSVSESGVDGTYLVPLELQKDAVLSAVMICERFNIDSGVNLNIPHCLFTEDEFVKLQNDTTVTSGCSMRSGSGTIFNVDGSLTVCNHFIDFEVASYEKCRALFANDKFLDFWNSEELQDLRAEVTCYHSQACFNCGQWVNCGGGCPVNWMYFDPESADLTPMNISERR